MEIIKWFFGTDFASLITALALAYGVFKVPKSIHDEKRAKALKKSVKVMLAKYMASEEGIVFAGYPNNKNHIVSGVSRALGIEEKLVEEILEELHKNNEI